MTKGIGRQRRQQQLAGTVSTPLYSMLMRHTLVCHRAIEVSVIVANICPLREAQRPVMGSLAHADSVPDGCSGA